MENKKNLRHGDKVYYIIYDQLKKIWTWQEGSICGQLDLVNYRIFNPKLNLEVTVPLDKIYIHLPNCQMDIMFLNGELKNDK